MNDLIFRKITAKDTENINKLLKTSFPNSNENRAVVKLRKNLAPILEYSLIAQNEKQEIVAQIYFYYVKLPSLKTVPMLGPLSVCQDYRGKGLGNAMVEHGLHYLSGLECGVLIVGPYDYYAEYGFDTECVKKLRLKGDISPFVLMGLEFEEDIFSNEKGTITS